MPAMLRVGDTISAEISVHPGQHVYGPIEAPCGYSIALERIWIDDGRELTRDIAVSGMFHGDGGLLLEEQDDPRGIFIYPPITCSFRMISLWMIVPAWCGNREERKRALLYTLGVRRAVLRNKRIVPVKKEWI